MFQLNCILILNLIFPLYSDLLQCLFKYNEKKKEMLGIAGITSDLVRLGWVKLVMRMRRGSWVMSS
jgi:hypothetical protein